MKNISFKSLFYLFIVIWPVIFLVNEIIGFPTVLLALVTSCISLGYLLRLNKKKAIRLIIIFSTLYIIQLLLIMLSNNFDNNLKNIADLTKFMIRWSNFITYISVLSENKVFLNLKKCFISRKKIIFNLAFIVVVVEVISIFFSVSYEMVWEGKYFKSFLYSPHVNSYFLISLMSIFILMYFYNYKKIISIISVGITLALNLMTGARTTGILAIMIVMLAIFSVALKLKNIISKKQMIIGGIIGSIIIIVLALTVDFKSIPLVEKFFTVLNDPSGFLNGRNYIWGNMGRYIVEEFNILNYFTGIGLAQSMQVNDFYIGQALWAHNDFIETFIGCGAIGILIMINTIKSYVFKTKEYLIGGIILIIMFFNGLFLYTELLIAIPLLTLIGIEMKENFKLSLKRRQKK